MQFRAPFLTTGSVGCQESSKPLGYTLGSHPERSSPNPHPFSTNPSLHLESKSCWGSCLCQPHNHNPELISKAKCPAEWASLEGLRAWCVGIVKKISKRGLSSPDQLTVLEVVHFLKQESSPLSPHFLLLLLLLPLSNLSSTVFLASLMTLSNLDSEICTLNSLSEVFPFPDLLFLLGAAFLISTKCH